MSEWVDILTPSLAVIAVFLAVGLAVQAWRHGRAIRRLEERLEQVGAAAVEGPLQRLTELGQRMRTQGGRPTGGGVRTGGARATRPVVLGGIVLVVLAVLVAGGWVLFLRGSGEGAATATRTDGGTGTAGTTTPAAPDPGRCGTVRPLADNGAVTVTILNASGVEGVANEKIAPDINLQGYRLGLVANPPDGRSDLRRSQVQYVRASDRDAACNVAKTLSLARVSPVEGYTPEQIGGAEVNVVVVVGKDLARR